MQRDIRKTPLYQEAETLFDELRHPGAGVISDALGVSAKGDQVVFAGTLVDSLNGTPPTRICLTNLTTVATRVLTFGPNTDRSPRFSPDGQKIAFVSDRHKAGDFQLYLLDPVSGAARATPAVDGWVEYLHWSPDGKRILLGVAGHGADMSGGQGAVQSKKVEEDVPSWMPAVETGDESYRWRRAWIYDVAADSVRQVSGAESNIWESVWCGNEALAGVVSPGPSEGLWYTARLHIIDIATGNSREIYAPRNDNQLGWPSASSSGKHLAIVEAICSDRWIVAGDLRIIETDSGKVLDVNTHGIDVTYTEWQSDRDLLLGGYRGFETVVGLHETTSGAFTEVWCSRDVATAGRTIVSGLNEVGDCVLVGEGFLRAPEIGVIRNGTYRPVTSFDQEYSRHSNVIESVEQVRWRAPDGLEIRGWLLLPQGEGPHPLVMYVHGGPVGQWRTMWLGRGGGAFALLLLRRGYAVFYPNPRGSSGRGQSFARHVLGDMGGADTYDYLSGLDHLVAQGIADPKRLGVTGASYGGFMTSWLITQDERFGAAVVVAPHTNQVTERLLSNIPQFEDLFLADTYTNPGGKYFQRSSIMHAQKVRTPTLNICGALDLCTPPEEAVQFHNALLENNVTSVLVTYPEEGHGIRAFPACIDYAARVVDWFEKYIGSK